MNNSDTQETPSHRRKRYPIRDEIEQIIKDKHIDRSRFGEFSKAAYKNVFGRFFYTFAKHGSEQKYDSEYFRINSSDDSEFFWNHLRENLGREHIASFGSDWFAYCNEIKEALPVSANKKAYLILREGWVYEGYPEEIMKTLAETSILLTDFYIVSKKYDWFIGHSDDGECAYIYYRKGFDKNGK